MKDLPYDRQAAVAYARTWAFRRNPAYLDFERLGGDCTNFASQCIFAGCGVMNTQKDVGWYYFSSDDRAAAWTGVEYLYRFLIGNKGVGPYAVLTDESGVELGDIIQLGDGDGRFYHSLVVVGAGYGAVTIAAHTDDAYGRTLHSYDYGQARFLHIVGARA